MSNRVTKNHSFTILYNLSTLATSRVFNLSYTIYTRADPIRLITLRAAVARFRKKSGRITWRPKNGTEAKVQYLKKILSPECLEANSIKRFRDLNDHELAGLRGKDKKENNEDEEGNDEHEKENDEDEKGNDEEPTRKPKKLSPKLKHTRSSQP